jgi:hypothetical protein
MDFIPNSTMDVSASLVRYLIWKKEKLDSRLRGNDNVELWDVDLLYKKCVGLLGLF